MIRVNIQELNVPGEALVQGREIGLRNGSHVGQLDHHRIERKSGRRRHQGGDGRTKKNVDGERGELLN